MPLPEWFMRALVSQKPPSVGDGLLNSYAANSNVRIPRGELTPADILDLKMKVGTSLQAAELERRKLNESTGW
jgi:hypothetical protein